MVSFVIFLAGASAAEPGPVTHAELLQWREEIWNRVRTQPVHNNPLDTYDPTGSAAYLIQQGSYTIESAAPTLDMERNPIWSVTLNDVHAEGPRGTGLGMRAEEILATYQNDNPALIGGEEFAALYVYDARERAELPEAAWGLVMRDHRGLLNIEYAVSAPLEEAGAFSAIIMSYVITDGLVTDMRVSGFGDSMLSEELRESIDTVRGIAADSSYDPEVGMQPPLHAEMFHLGDLFFSGLDFLEETEQSVRDMFGTPTGEERVPAEEGGPGMLLLAYPGLEFEFSQGDGRLIGLQITEANFPGPRGLRLGDTLAEVLYRFRMEEQAQQETLTILYAPGDSIEQPPFGLLESFVPWEATVRYAVPVDAEEAVMLLITVEETRVTELYLYRWRMV